MEVSSFNCRSENDNIFSLEEHLNNMAENLSLIHQKKQLDNKAYIYKEIYRFIRNFDRFDFDAELLIKKKVGKYLSILYNLLIEINDYECESYSVLLPAISCLISKVKKLLISFVRYPHPSTNLETETWLSILAQMKMIR